MSNGIFNVNVSKLNRVESFDFDALPESSRRWVIQYGLNKGINDSHASIKRDDFPSDEAWLAAVAEPADKRVGQIRNGDVPRAGVVVNPKAAVAAQYGISVEDLDAALAARAKKSRAA